MKGRPKSPLYLRLISHICTLYLASPREHLEEGEAAASMPGTRRVAVLAVGQG